MGPGTYLGQTGGENGKMEQSPGVPLPLLPDSKFLARSRRLGIKRMNRGSTLSTGGGGGDLRMENF